MKSIPYIDDLDEWRQSFYFSIPIKIRFSETDMFGHMNNVSAFTYFEEGRIEFLKSLNLFDRSTPGQGVPIVGDLQCDYHNQIYFDDHLTLYVKAHYTGRTSVDIHYMALNTDNVIVLTGRGRLVYVNPQTGNPVELTDHIKQALLNA